MDLHTWITQQVDEVEKRARACTATDWRHVHDGVIVDRDTDGWQSAPDNARIASIAHERIYWTTSPAYSPDADHIVHNDPDTVLRRCEADRRILARHRIDPDVTYEPACEGCGTYSTWTCPTSTTSTTAPSCWTSRTPTASRPTSSPGSTGRSRPSPRAGSTKPRTTST